MLVIILVGDIDLAYLVPGQVAVDLRKHADLQTPVAGNAQVADEITAQRELSRQRVTEAVHEIQVIHPADDFFQGTQQRRDEQPGGAPAELLVMNAGVIALAELEIEGGIRNRVEQSCRQSAVVGDDVAVMQGDRLAVAARQGIAEAEPGIAALARLTW